MDYLSILKSPVLEMSMKTYLAMKMAQLQGVRNIQTISDERGLRVRVEFNTSVAADIAKKQLKLESEV